VAFWPFLNKHGVQMVALCCDKSLSDLVDMSQLAALYRHVGLPKVALDIEASAATRLVGLLEGGKDLEMEAEERFWLLGLVYGYPIWSTVAFYLTGQTNPADGGGGETASGDHDCEECEAEGSGDQITKSREQKRKRDTTYGGALQKAVEEVVSYHRRDGSTLPTLHRILSNLVAHAEETVKYGSLRKTKPKVGALVSQPRVMNLLICLGFVDSAEFVSIGPGFDLALFDRVVEELKEEEKILEMMAGMA